MTLRTKIDAKDLLSQLDDELVIDYLAENKTITEIVTALLAFQVNDNPITLGTIQPVVTRSMQVQQEKLLTVLLKLRNTVGGFIEVDIDRQLNWWSDIGEDKGQQIRYRKNIMGLTRTMDFSNFGNRLYCYGAGEGEARIKLSDAEGQEEDYVESPGSQETYGICIRQLVDKSITHPETLLAWANLKLTEMEVPYINYRIDMVNLGALEGFNFDVLQLGSMVKVLDEDLGIDIDARIMKIIRNLTDPINIQVEISNPGKDILDLLGGVYDTQQFIEHIATMIGAGQVIVLGAFTVLDWVTEGQTTIIGGFIEADTITATQLIKTQAVITESAQIDEAVILSAHIGNLEVKTANIDSLAVTNAKIQSLAAEKITTGDLLAELAVLGKIIAGEGAVILDPTGLGLYGEILHFYDEGDNYRAAMFATLDGLEIWTIGVNAGIWLNTGLGGVNTDRLYVSTRMKAPVGVDMYD